MITGPMLTNRKCRDCWRLLPHLLSADSTIYWADWNRREPRIERASLDGSNRQVLLDADLGLPNSLAIDFATDELCWTDAGTKSVGQSRREGDGARARARGRK